MRGSWGICLLKKVSQGFAWGGGGGGDGQALNYNDRNEPVDYKSSATGTVNHESNLLSSASLCSDLALLRPSSFKNVYSFFPLRGWLKLLVNGNK